MEETISEADSSKRVFSINTFRKNIFLILFILFFTGIAYLFFIRDMDVIAQKETIYVLNKTNSYFSDANLNTYLDMCYMSIYDDNGNIFSRAYYDSESNLINKNLYTFDD